MKKLSEATGKLTWVRVNETQRQYALRSSDGETFANLHWEKDTGTLARGEADGDSWTFKRVGFLHPFVGVRDAKGVDIARAEIGLGGMGSIQFTDGERYVWTANLWRAEWGWYTPSGSPLVQFRRDFAIDQRAGETTIPADHLGTIHLSMLTILGWYLIVLLGEDAAVAYSMSGR